jgi:hypothetical protein
VRLGDRSDERVHLVHAAVDRLQPRGEGRAPDALDRVLAELVAARRERVALVVLELYEVQDVRIVDWIPGVDPGAEREALGGLAGDVREDFAGGSPYDVRSAL